MKLWIAVLSLALGLLATPARAASCDGPAAYSAANRGVAVLVMRDGAVVCEAYAAGMDRDTPHPLFSGTKGFTGLMAAAAAADGLLRLDELAADTLGEWRADPLKSQIRIHHVLSLTSGLSTGGPQAAPSFKDAIARPGEHPPGETFAYGPIVFQTFGEILTRKLAAAGRDPAPTAYLQSRILDPIGAKVSAWGGPTAGSDPNLAAGAQMSAADWAKVGELVRLPALAAQIGLDPGVYEAQFAPSTAANPGYGLTWWLSTPIAPDFKQTLDRVARSLDLSEGVGAGTIPAGWVVAAGAGGQRLYVNRDLGLTIVRFASMPDFAAMREALQRGGRRNPSAAVSGGNFSDTAFLSAVLQALPRSE